MTSKPSSSRFSGWDFIFFFFYIIGISGFGEKIKVPTWAFFVTAAKEKILADQTFYRRYVQNLNLPDGQMKYYGIACRSAQGDWLIPRR